MSGWKKLAARSKKWVGAGVLFALMQSALALDLARGDFQQILDARASEPMVWQYADNPNVYVFDFPGLSLQGRSFNRVTQFTEQQFSEPYPRVLRSEEMAAYIAAARRSQADFAFGHDILVGEMVQFLNYAERDKVVLNPEEAVVRDFLVGQGLVRVWRGIYQAMRPEAVILSIPQVQEKKSDEPMITKGARYAILLHEMAHGEYYSNAHYAKFCQRFWAETLTDNQREAFKNFLGQFNYSVNSEELMINEMQAYLMFTPDPKSFNARKLGVSDAELQGMRDAFRRGRPPTRLPLSTLEGL